MATSPDHPELQFVQAKGYTPGRPDGLPLWIVIHDMEATETRLRAENTALYFANPGDGRSVSSHYCADNDSVVQCVRLRDSAWTVGNRPGNNRGINWELSGFAAQTRDQWLDEFGLAMFERIAPIIRADAARYGIPLQRRTVAELKAFRPGITSHNDLRLAFGGTTHTDPGPNFPWDHLLNVLMGDDMSAADVWAYRFKGKHPDGTTYDFSAQEMLTGANTAAWRAVQLLEEAAGSGGTVPPGAVGLTAEALAQIQAIVDEQVDQGAHPDDDIPHP